MVGMESERGTIVMGTTQNSFFPPTRTTHLRLQNANNENKTNIPTAIPIPIPIRAPEERESEHQSREG
jgi:hypothetical protein